jgi:hypothetical protein
MRRFRIIVSRACADEPAGTSPPTTGYGGSRKRRHVAQGAGNTDEDLAVIEAAVASSLVASSLLLAQPAHAEKRVALVIGNNDYKNVPKLQKALKRRPDHGRHPQATRFFGDGCGEPDAAGLQPDPAGIRQPGDTAFFFSALRSRGRISCCRPMCRRRPRVRKNWCATHRSWPTASSSGCRTRRCAPPSWCSMPAATIRSSEAERAPSPAAVVSRR